VLAQLGAVILLFEVGLESTVRDMMQVGLRSLLVAVLGVVTPWVLGWWVGALLLPEHSVYVHAFLGWLSIGIGMIPRGEVGLIFANIGLTLVVRGEHTSIRRHSRRS
jgi:Kef-type K+ transport system membrane component KefB